MRSRKPFLAAAAMGLGLLTGCASHQLDDHSLQFNQAAGSQSMRLLLLNAVRASKDYPLQFSKIQTYRGKGSLNHASISASLPLKQTLEGSLSPKFELNDGISQFDLVDLSTEEAQEALKRPLTHEAYVYHSSYSGNRSAFLPQLLLVEQIALSSELHSVIKDSVQCTCGVVENRPAECRSVIERVHEDLPKVLKEERRKYDQAINAKKKPKQEIDKDYKDIKKAIEKLVPDSKNFAKDLKRGGYSFVEELKYACDSLEKLKEECPGIADNLPLTMEKKVVLKNDLSTECGHKSFLFGLLQFRIIGANPRAGEKQTDKPDDKPEGADKPEAAGRSPGRTEKKGGDTFHIYAVDQKNGDSKKKSQPAVFFIDNKIFAASCVGARLCEIGGNQPPSIRKEHISPLPRSTERVVRYLGDLISAQNFGEHTYMPTLFDPERKQRPTLLTVKRGLPLLGAAVSVRDPEGATFYIPRRDHGSAKTDLSLETLAIVTDVLNAAVSKKNFPPITTLTVASP